MVKLYKRYEDPGEPMSAKVTGYIEQLDLGHHLGYSTEAWVGLYFVSKQLLKV